MGEQDSWRYYSEDPKSVLGWTLLTALREMPALLGSTIVIVLLAGVAAALAALVGLFDLPSFAGPVSFSSRGRRAPGSLAALAPLPSQEPWFPIRVVFRRGGVQTGFDDGIAVIGEGWFHVEGRRTTFSFQPEELRDALCGEGCSFDWSDLTLEIKPYDQIGDRKDMVAGFDQAVRAFRWELRKFANATGGTPRFPTRKVHPSAFGRAWAGVLHGGLLFDIALGLGLLLHGFGAIFVAVVVGACGLFRVGRGVFDLLRLQSYSS